MRPATNVTLSTRQDHFHMAIPTAFKTDPSTLLFHQTIWYSYHHSTQDSVLKKVKTMVPGLGGMGSWDVHDGTAGETSGM